MNCLRIGALALAAVMLSACGSKGEKGDAGPAGPAGPQGGLHPAPQIEAVSPPFVTRNQQIAVFGSGFDTDFAANRVYVGNHPATILDGDATTLIVTASVPVDVLDEVSSLLVTVVSHNQTSNPYEVLQIPPGLEFQLGQATTYPYVSGHTMDANGDQLVSHVGIFVGEPFDRVNRVASATGNVTTEVMFAPEGTSIGGTAWKRADGHYYLTADLSLGGSQLYRMTAEGEQQKVFAAPGIFGSDGVWDAAGNLYYFQNNIGRFFFFGPSPVIMKWDRAAKTVTTFRTMASGVQGVAIIGDFLYAADAGGQIEKIELADPSNITNLFVTPAAGSIGALGTDGTDLLAWADSDAANGFELTKYDTAGAATIFSDLDFNFLFTTSPTKVSTDAAGRWFVGSVLLGTYRVPNDTTKEAWYASTIFGGAYGTIGDRTFLGTGLVCQVDPDGLGSPLYEVLGDGSLRRASGAVCSNSGTLGDAGGRLVQYNTVTTAFERIDVDTGAVTTLFDVDDAVPEIDDPYLLTTDASGNVYAVYDDSTLGEYSVAKISAAGVLTDDFVLFPNFESPSAIVVQGGRLVIGDDSSTGTLLEAPLAAGGTATYIDQAISLYTYTMTVGDSGDVLILDDNGSLMFLRPDNTIEHRYTTSLSGAYYREAELGYLYGFDESQNFTVVLP